MRNITSWGSGVKAKRLLEDPPFGASMVGFLETHTRSEDVNQQLDILASCGWKGVATPSRQDLRGRSAGGVAAGVRSFHKSHSYRHLAARAEQQAGLYQGKKPQLGELDFYDFVPFCVKLQGMNTITIVFAYFTPGHAAIYAQKLKLLGAFVAALNHPWIIMADWNLEPAELQETGWVRQVGGALLVPRAGWTCSSSGRLIDFAVCSASCTSWVREIGAHMDGPWTAHKGVFVRLAQGSNDPGHLTLAMPRPFMHPPKAAKGAGPESKRSRAKARSAATGEETAPAGEMALLLLPAPGRARTGLLPAACSAARRFRPPVTASAVLCAVVALGSPELAPLRTAPPEQRSTPPPLSLAASSRDPRCKASRLFALGLDMESLWTRETPRPRPHEPGVCPARR